MNSKLSMAVAISSLALASPGFAADWTAQVGQVQSTSLGADCVYFTLSGISVADPSLGNNSSWFAIPRSQYGAKDAYAMLLTARATGVQVRVTTTGTTICGGYAQISQLILQ
jgi:hypothetical protein